MEAFKLPVVKSLQVKAISAAFGMKKTFAQEQTNYLSKITNAHYGN